MSPIFLRSLLASFLAAALPLRAAVLFNEIQYHPVEKGSFNPDGSPVLDLTEDVHEFIELINTGPGVAELGGWQLSGGIQYAFPAGTRIPEGGFAVISGHPGRIISVYSLPSGSVLGPWTGHLGNRSDRLELQDRSGAIQDAVEYRGTSPWPSAADSLGAPEEWTQINPMDHQYRGRSLERVSVSHPSNDPSNWVASPLASGPSPGRGNALVREIPRPVVVAWDVRQADNGSDLLRAGRPVRVECVFTGGTGLTDVQLEWYREDLDALVKPTTRQPLWPVGSGLDARFQAEVPGQPNRSVIRFRILANRGDGIEVVSPRADDAFAWHGWFVTPPRAPTTNPVYDLFISQRSLNILRTNIASEPRRVTRPEPPGNPRASWNATQPAILVHEGRVYDVQMRHHGSQFRRDVSRRSYKIQFPNYARLGGREGFFLTDKDVRTVSGHTVFRAAGLPTSRTWWSELYMNTASSPLRRLAQEEYDDFLLDRHHAEAASQSGDPIPVPSGEFYKSQGVFDEPTGPYGRGDGSLLRARIAAGRTLWTPRQRYEWTYTQQMHGWKGHGEFERMITNLWKARNNSTQTPTGATTNALREYFGASWDLDKTLTHVALFNWQGVWDDTIHNYFLWQQSNGRWSLLPWDFDDQFESQPATGSIFNGNPFAGPNYFKQSLIAAFRDEFREKAWWLNNTLLDPDNLSALGVPNSTRTWAASRQRSVNTQLRMGFFGRPLRPTNSFPVTGERIGPGGSLVSTAYLYNTNPIVAQAASVWQIRELNRSWLEPVLTSTNTDSPASFLLGIGRLVPGRTYAWRVQHVDLDGHPSPWSAETRFVFGPESGSAVLLSEALAVNTGSVRNGSDRPDYLELVNVSDDAVHIGGWTVTDALDTPSRFVIPEGTRIPARGFLVLWCDNKRNSPGLHTGFGLKREGETLALFAPGPSGLRLVDLLTFGPQLPDLAAGRVPADGGAWTLVQPSPSAPNSPVDLGDPGTVRINEWLASAANASDWFELFNASGKPVDLGGLIASDGTDSGALPPLTFVAAGGFLKLTADGAASPFEDHLPFRLSGGGGSILLSRPDRTLVDRVLYPPQRRGISQGRVPDGGEGVYPLPRPSPESTNASDTDFDGLPDAWELAHQLNPLLDDRDEDADSDGWSNETEFLLGFDPNDATRRLHLEVVPSRSVGTPDALSFLAAPGHRYRVERHGLPNPGWQTIHTEEPTPTLRTVTLPLSSDDSNPGGLFRVVTE